ncbi:NAD(P)-dependent alcohol dehydrogenase [Rhodococcus sp. T7]|uniref:NAD(P)-dependent alcohol dehydrogenase n=1 Tax=Rhodococcus sp. T7 TaxID=627444 RepID=UPI00135B404E|nr:NAD(P)-dependent alcohol dehydrogenase [Rhodococcus sp. T7]KAF0957772.1 Aryl-alcohol dehydrogenase [Rhodococcus sp. T7]KAF0959938.1 Aryl-alcohol dehydrogenase [Rhodococcus sp. T7]
MRITAAVAREAEKPFLMEEVELDDPLPGEVLVEVHASGLCHTDIGVRNQWMPIPLPLVLGHEGAGVVKAVGEGVTKVAPGDKVVMTFDSCGSCVMCSRGLPSYCREFAQRNTSGGRPDGTNALHGDGDLHGAFFSQSSFATYAIATDRNVVRLDDDVDLAIVGPLGCGIQTGAGTVINRLAPSAGSSLVVFGAGAVGLSALMAAKVVGCTKIIAVDRVPARLELATELGATHVLDATTTPDMVAAIQQITGLGADYAIDTTAVTSVVRQAVSALAPTGTCAILGFGPAGTDVAVDMIELLTAGRTIVGVTEGDARPDEFIPKLIDLHRRGQFPFEKMIDFYDFADINQAADDSDSGKTIKPVLKMK